jgi:hypothetical protein
LQACYEAAFQEKNDAEMHREAKEQSARKVLEKEEALLAIEEEESCKLNIEAENTARVCTYYSVSKHTLMLGVMISISCCADSPVTGAYCGSWKHHRCPTVSFSVELSLWYGFCRGRQKLMCISCQTKGARLVCCVKM